MIVLFSAAAKADIEEIDARISEVSPARADRVAELLNQACDGLADMPRRFQLLPRFESLGVRRRVVEDYLIFYRVEPASVQILRILHGATDYVSKLLQEE